MYKRKFFCVILFLVSIFIGLRIYILNKKVEYPKTVIWKIGEEVNLERNYFYDIFEICEGYSVCVNEAELLEYDDFRKKYHYGEDEEKKFSQFNYRFPDMVYDVTVTIKNKNKETKETGINFYNYNLCASDYILSVDSYLYELANAEKKSQSMMISLQPESELVFHLPYSIEIDSPDSYLDKNALQTEDLYLLLSMYPVQNQILISREI